jgi:glycogen debranching enzyme
LALVRLFCQFTEIIVQAPDLLPANNAWTALNTAKQLLLGPLGMRTLDPGWVTCVLARIQLGIHRDLAYRGDYDNNDQGTDASTAQGWNYHQGPEWLWPMAFYCRARLAVARALDTAPAWAAALKEVKHIMSAWNVHMHTSAWRSLPELTNKVQQFDWSILMSFRFFKLKNIYFS